MANTLLDPLATAAAADVPNAGAPAAPAGDTPGANPFHGLALPTQTPPITNEPQSATPPAPAPAPNPAPQAAVPTGNPFDGFATAPSQGTATAAGSGTGAGQVPSGQAASVPNPFDGFTSPVTTPESAPVQTPAQEQKSLGTAIYQGTKTLALKTLEDLSNGVQLLWAQGSQPGGVIKGMPIMVDSKGQLWDQDRMNSAGRGAAMIGTAPLAPAEALVPALGQGFFSKVLIGKVLAQIANGEFGGALYGAAAPLENGDTRWDSIKDNAYGLGLQVPLMHGAFKLLGWPIGKALDKLGIPQKIADAMRRPDVTPAHIAEANTQLEQVLQEVKANGANPEHLPEDVKENLVAMSIHNAVDQPDVANLDERTLAWEQATQDTHGVTEINPRTLGQTEPPPQVTGLTPPRDVLLPEPTPGEGQIRIAQGVYQNPDGSYDTYGYRGVSRRPLTAEEQVGYNDYGTGLRSVERGPTEPGLMNTIYMSPNGEFASGFGTLHYVGAHFDNPLLIDNWHDTLPDSKMEKIAAETTSKINGENSVDIKHPKYGDVSYFGTRQPGVIDAARAMGYDAIIVRHGNEAVEIVALQPEKVYSAGAAPIAGADEAGNQWHSTGQSFTPATEQQKAIADKASRAQRGVTDLGHSNADFSNTVLTKGGTVNSYSTHQNHVAYRQVMQILDKHLTIPEGPNDQAFSGKWGSHFAGEYKINGRVLSVTPAEDGIHGSYNIKDITGKLPTSDNARDIGLSNSTYVNASETLRKGVPLTKYDRLGHDQVTYSSLVADLKGQPVGDYHIGGRIIRYDDGFKIDSKSPTFQDVTLDGVQADPTIHPDLLQSAMIQDAVAKASSQIDLKALLGDSNKAVAEKLAGYEPEPRGFGKQSQIKKLDIHGESAVNKAAVGQIDNALLDLTAPRELDLERPELSNVGGQKTKLPKNLLNRDIAAVEKELLPERAKQRAAVEQNYSSAEKRSSGRLVLEPYEREVLVRYRDMLNLVRKQAPDQIPKVESWISEVLDNARARSEGAAKLDGEYQVGLINVVPSTQERAPWSPVPDGVAVPQVPSDFAMLARMTMEQREGIADVSEAPGLKKGGEAPPPAKVPPRSQRSLTGGGSSNKVGATNFSVIFRVASGGSSALLYGAGVNTQDPKTRKLLMTASGILATLAVMPTKGGWFEKSELGEALMKMMDLPAFMKSTIGDKAESRFRSATDLMNYWTGTAKMRGMAQAKMFKTPMERELFARALDDPNNVEVWSQLTHEQQQFVGQEGIINHQLGQMLKKLGIIENFRDNYVRHIYLDETFNAWRSAKGSLHPGGFTKPRVFEKLSDAENWAKANNLPGPLLDGVQLQSKHFLEVGRALMGKQIVDDMKNLGLLIDRGKTTPLGWVSPKVNGMHDLVAPEAVALGLERLSNYRPGILDTETLKGLDAAKSWMMRSIMAFPWIHGINVVRGALALDGTGLAYTRSLKAMQAADPSIARALKAGVRLFDRPDFAEKHAEGFSFLLDKLGESVGPTIGNATFNPASAALRAGEHALWDKWVPALGLGAFNKQMYNWAERTGGQFAEGTPEFAAAAREAADFANTVMGKSLDTMKDPGLSYLLRNIFFAPQWMSSRIRISMGALGELRGIATGEVSLGDAKYLPYKVRSLLIGAAFTYVASRLWSGKDPEFNPNNNKFYIRTGVYDRNRREVGVDVAGWWADDVKMFGDPAKYFMNRLSPMIQVAHTMISGRDAFGRSIGGLELADEIANEFGPLGAMGDVGARVLNRHGSMSGADAIKGVLGSTDIGSSASLPRPVDQVLQGLSYRILRQQGLPQDDDRIYELQQILASNQRQGKPIVDGAVLTWLAYQRLSYVRQFPKPAGIRYLWKETQMALRNIGR